jgi:DNA-binding transcriptional LysR family regulator
MNLEQVLHFGHVTAIAVSWMRMVRQATAWLSTMGQSPALPEDVVCTRRAYPQIEIRANMGNTAQVATAVEDRATELGFVEAAIRSEQLTSTAVARDQIIVITAPGHQLLKRKPITPTDLVEVEWVLRERGSGTRSVFEDALEECGLKARTLRIALELPSNEAVRSAAEAGLGAAVISASIAAPSLEAGFLQQIDFRLPEREFYVLTQRDRHLSRAARAFLEMLTDSRTAKRSRRPNV